MKLKLILSYNRPFSSDDDYGITEDCDSAYSPASNAAIRREDKERHILTVLRRELYEHCFDGQNYRFNNVLVTVPDESLFQCMIDGVSDNHYIAYNIYSKKMVISDNARLAVRSADIIGSYDEYERNSGCYPKACSEDYEDSILVLDWKLDSFNQYITDKSYHLELQGELYGNVYNEIKEFVIPVVDNIIINNFICFSSEITKITKFNAGRRSQRVYHDYEECAVGSGNQKVNLHLTIDEVMLVLEQYYHNLEYWQMAKPELTEYDIESIKNTFYLKDGMN